MGGHSARRENKQEALAKLNQSNRRVAAKIVKQAPPRKKSAKKV